jgi:hypothetical protein
MGRTFRGKWLAATCALGALGVSFFVALMVLPEDQSPEHRPAALVQHLQTTGFRASEFEPGKIGVRRGNLLVALYFDEHGTLHILMSSEQPAERIGLQAINAWNRDTSLVKVYADDDGFVTFEASMLRGTTQSLQTVSDLLELFLTFVDDFLNSHAQQPATTNPYDSPIEWEKERT